MAREAMRSGALSTISDAAYQARQREERERKERAYERQKEEAYEAEERFKQQVAEHQRLLKKLYGHLLEQSDREKAYALDRREERNRIRREKAKAKKEKEQAEAMAPPPPPPPPPPAPKPAAAASAPTLGAAQRPAKRARLTMADDPTFLKPDAILPSPKPRPPPK